MELEIHVSKGVAIARENNLDALATESFERFASHVRRVSLVISDQNGPRGGNDTRCILRVTLEGLPEVVVEETRETVEQAVGMALARAARAVARAVERRRRYRDYRYRRFIGVSSLEA
ncbi:MAG: hypothetical protein U1A77_07705 [Pirellulales bacterium]